MGFFDRKESENPEVKRLNDKVEKLEKQKADLVDDQAREINHLKEDHRVALERKDAEVDTRVSVATKKLTEDLAKVTMEKNNAEQKAEILETAFKNLGFDVKDMKGILNKLVDGIVSKNTIQLVK